MARHLPLAAFVLLVTFANAARAEQIGPSFDCQRARAALAQILCSDPDLSRLDLRFAQAYWALLQQVGETGAPDLKEEDVWFIEMVPSECGIPQSFTPPAPTGLKKCVGDLYEKQRLAWASRLTGAAAEEATRRSERHIALQSDLQKLGFLPPEQVIDGVYGPKTRDAIREWQNSIGHPVTGFLGNSDATALEGQIAKTTSDQAAQEQAARDQAAREQAAREQAAQEQAAQEQAARQQVERAAAEERQRLAKTAAKEQLRKKLTDLGYTLLDPVDLDLDWQELMASNKKVAVIGTYLEANDVEELSTPDNRDQPEIRVYTTDASRDARKLMLECRNSNFQIASCQMAIGATIASCTKNKGQLNEKQVPCLKVNDAYLIPDEMR